MIKHYELRHKENYIAKLQEDRDRMWCIEMVFFNGEQVHRAEFPSSFLGGASRGEYLQCMASSIAREHSKKENRQ